MPKILDAGCGLGRYVYNMSLRIPGEYFGIDLDENNIASAKASYNTIQFEQMSVEELGFSDKYFDVVISRDVLEHVNSLEKALSEIVRVLKPGGKLIVKLPAYKSEMWLKKIRPTYWQEIHHVRAFKKDDLEKMLMPYKLDLKKFEPQGFTDHFFLYFLFKTSDISETQVALGSWKGHWWGYLVAPIHAYLKPELVFDTWLKYIPIWILTLPLGWLINFIGNKWMPKSWYYEFIKQNE